MNKSHLKGDRESEESHATKNQIEKFNTQKTRIDKQIRQEIINKFFAFLERDDGALMSIMRILYNKEKEESAKRNQFKVVKMQTKNVY